MESFIRFILELFPKNLLIRNTKKRKFRTSICYHSWRTTKVELIKLGNIFLCYPISYISWSIYIFCKWGFFTRKILEVQSIFKIYKSSLYFVKIKRIFKVSDTKNKCMLVLCIMKFLESKKPCIKRSKTSPSTNETFSIHCLSEKKMPKRKKSGKNCTNGSITNNRASSPIRNSLYNQSKSSISKRRKWICSTQSWGKLKENIMSWFYCFYEKIRTVIYKLIYIWSKRLLWNESKLCFNHTKKLLNGLWEVLRFLQIYPWVQVLFWSEKLESFTGRAIASVRADTILANWSAGEVFLQPVTNATKSLT